MRRGLVFVVLAIAGLASAGRSDKIVFECSNASAKCGPCKAEKPIIIIGAGVSGLSAAFHLKQAGCTNVIVLEARDHIGGRMFSETLEYTNPKTGHTNKYVIHKGANWIHGKNNPVWDLNNQLNLFPTQWLPRTYTTYPTFGTKPRSYTGNGSYVPGEDVRDKFEEYVLQTENFDDWLESVMDGRSDIPDLPFTYFLGEYIKDMTGAELDEFMVFMGIYNTFMDGDDLFHVGLGNEISANRGLDKEMMVGWPGYNSLNEYLAQGIDVRLNQEVAVVEWDATNGVQVLTAGGDSFQGSAILVTIPLGTLQHRTIRFKPDLPYWKWHAVDDIGFALLDKLFLRWDSAWWPNTDAFWKPKRSEANMGKVTASEWYNIYNFKVGTDDGSRMPPILLTTPAGLAAKLMENMSDQQVIDMCMAEFASMFPNTTIPKPVQLIRTEWWKDKFAYGAFASPTVGTDPLSFDCLAQSIQNVLFFAGEATSSDRFGYVDGAFITGERAAKEILNTCCSTGFDGSADPLSPKLPSNHKELRAVWARRTIETLRMRHPKFVSKFASRN